MEVKTKAGWSLGFIYNALEVRTEGPSERPRPDNFCIHRVVVANTLLMTVG